MSFEDSLFTWYQFLQVDTVNRFRLSVSAKNYAEQIFAQTPRIVTFQDAYDASILIATHYIAAGRDSVRDSVHDSADISNRIGHLKSMLCLYSDFGEKNIDTLGVCTPGKNLVVFETGMAYTSTGGMADYATIYFTEALKLTRRKIAENLKKTSYYLDLQEQYRTIGLSRLSRALKRRIFTFERLSIRSTIDIPARIKKQMRKAAKEIKKPNGINSF